MRTRRRHILRRVVLFLAALTAAAQTISTRNSEHYRWGDCCDGWYLVKNDRMNVIEERMPARTSEVRHVHRKAQQFFYVLKGEATLALGDRVLVLHEGEGALVIPGVTHRMQNLSTRDLELLVTSEPPSHGDREDVP